MNDLCKQPQQILGFKMLSKLNIALSLACFSCRSTPSMCATLHILKREALFCVTFCTSLTAMAFSSLTPVFVAIICVLIGLLLKSSKRNTKKEESKTCKKAVARPWVDEDLKDSTELHAEEDGREPTIALYLYASQETCNC